MEDKQQQPMNWKTQAKIIGGSVITAEAISLIAHGGWEGALFGLAAATILGSQSAPMLEALRDILPVDLIRQLNEREPGKRSVMDKLLDRHPDLREDADTQQNAVETEPLITVRMEDLPMRAYPPSVQPVAAIFPVYRENVTLHLGRVQATGQRFDPHVNGILGQGLIVTAMQGWGKSQLVGRIVEQCGRCGMMVVLFDHKGEHETITELPGINGLRAGADDRADFQLTAENAGAFVQLVMDNRHQAIINLPSYGMRWIERAAIVSAVGRELMNYAEEKRRQRQRVMPCLVLLDEAQLYIPQDATYLPPEAQANKEVQGELKNSFFALATNGRSAGYTVGFATQSLTFIAKALIKSCAIQVFGRHVEKNALDMCEDIIDNDVATRAQFKTFPKGVGVLSGFTEEPIVIQFDLKESRDLSETPTIEWLHMGATHESQTPKTSVLDEPVSTVTKRLADDLQVALVAYEPGMTYRDLGRALGYSTTADGAKIRAIWQELQRRGLLHSASVPTSQASSVPTSSAASDRRANFRVVNGREVTKEAGRSDMRRSEVGEAESVVLSEREQRIAALFFDEGQGINVIMRELWPGVTGGEKYQRANAEITDALRKYVQVHKGA